MNTTRPEHIQRLIDATQRSVNAIDRGDYGIPEPPIHFTFTPAAQQARTQAANADWRGGALARAVERQAKLIEQARVAKEQR